MIGGGNNTSEDLMNYNILSETSEEQVIDRYLEKQVNKLRKYINKKIRKYF